MTTKSDPWLVGVGGGRKSQGNLQGDKNYLYRDPCVVVTQVTHLSKHFEHYT